jgi:hypothetical protein
VPNVAFLFRVDIGFEKDRGYAAAVFDPQNQRQKGIRGNSMEQLLSRIRKVILDESRKARSFPLESERSNIILPNGF